MKKIFAIALALVMVLSMASAFASYCTAGFDWTCAADTYNCGKATVEVIPYVKTNAACNDFSYVESDCAAAIKGENVYYAIKLTVDEDVDADWWKEVEFELSVKGMKKNFSVDKIAAPVLGDDDSEDGWVFYYVFAKNAWGWSGEVTENDDFELATVVNKFVVDEYAKAKVCFTLVSDSEGTAGVVGDYYVEYVEAADAVKAKAATAATMTYTLKAGTNLDDFEIRAGWVLKSISYDTNKIVAVHPTAGKVLDDATIDTVVADEEAKDDVKSVKVVNGTPAVEAVAGEVNAIYVYDEKDGKLLVTYTIKDGKIGAIDYTAHCGEAAYATIKAFFGLEIGTCVDADLIAANFGWDDEVESCYAWKTENATAIVDTECVVAIPKTGDASVLAWLF